MASLKRIFGGLILLWPVLAMAQVQQPANGGTGTGTAPSAGQIMVGQSSGKYAPKTVNGSCTADDNADFSCSGGGGGGIQPVQKFLEYDCGSMAGNCNSIATPAPVTPGDMLVLEMLHSNGGTVSVSDTNGDTFTAANYQLVSGQFDFWQYVVCSAVGGATTVNLGTTPDFNVVAIYEFPPVASSGCVDGYSSAQGNNLSTLSSGSITVNYAQDLIFVTGATRTGSGGSTITEGNSYTSMESSGLVDAALTYNSWFGTLPGTGSLSDTLGYTNSPGGLYAGILAIKPAINPSPPYTGSSPITVTGSVIACPTCSIGSGNYTNIGASVTWSGCTFTSGACAVSGSSTTAVTISSIPGTYLNLHLVILGQSTSGYQFIQTQLNGDTSGHYSHNSLYTSSTTGWGGATNGTSVAFMDLGQLGASPNVCLSDIYIPYYAGGFTKILSSRWTQANGLGTIPNTAVAMGYWDQTSAITSVTFTIQGDDYAAGTVFMIYAEN